MSDQQVPHSPVFPQGKQWDFKKREGIYESDVTALLRRLLEDDAIREDQRAAWERWRNDPSGLQR
ncbi:MAG: hypothetical protein H6R21_60 [Proteobacteria bacterium]|jgi:hypothetical protein|nr:hypothetical protein [Pseudomonadota bacterium]RPJ47243.1 MAG: hypothetical protein EHM16_06665 [Betaproteobacteria bacterium]